MMISEGGLLGGLFRGYFFRGGFPPPRGDTGG